MRGVFLFGGLIPFVAADGTYGTIFEGGGGELVCSGDNRCYSGLALSYLFCAVSTVG